jgi:hypothetical protein
MHEYLVVEVLVLFIDENLPIPKEGVKRNHGGTPKFFCEVDVAFALVEYETIFRVHLLTKVFSCGSLWVDDSTLLSLRLPKVQKKKDR